MGFPIPDFIFQIISDMGGEVLHDLTFFDEPVWEYREIYLYLKILVINKKNSLSKIFLSSQFFSLTSVTNLTTFNTVTTVSTVTSLTSVTTVSSVSTVIGK